MIRLGTFNGHPRVHRGLYYYGARWYDASLARFIAADTIVPNPGNAQALNRYMYTLGNPMRYTDPTGHAICASEDCVVRVHIRTGQPAGMSQKWGIVMTGPWEADKAWWVYEDMVAMAERAGRELGDRTQGDAWLRQALGGTHLERWPNSRTPIHPVFVLTAVHTLFSRLSGAQPIWPQGPSGLALPAHFPLLPGEADTVYMFDRMDKTTAVHESGHIIDYRMGFVSKEMAKLVDRKRAPTDYGKSSWLEDFAESWKTWILDEPGLTSDRRGIIESLVVRWR